MKSPTTIRRLLAALMIAGIALAPLSRPVMAMTSPDASMSVASVADASMPVADDMLADMSTSASEQMSDAMAMDMPCCPSQAPMPPGCDKCIFMAACMAQYFVGASASAFQPVLIVSGDIVPLQNEARPDSLSDPPPDQPPRIST